MARVEPALHDLGHLLNYQVVKVLKDGRRQGLNSVFLIQVRMKSAPRKRRTAQCVLKVFHAQSRNKALMTAVYANELAANSVLSAPYASPSAERACAELFDAASVLRRSSACYPRCLGTVRVAEERIWDGGTVEFIPESESNGPPTKKKISSTQPSPAICKGFLLEYMEGIREITRDMVTPELADKLKTALVAIHALNVRHNDFEHHASWPEVRFWNVFVRPTGEPVILDFNRSRKLTDSPKDQAMLKQEADRLAEMLETAMGNKDPWAGISKETRGLLANSHAFYRSQNK